ncbi:MAG: hypothetical protein H0X65_12835 [Gemmatimonadetes bacterium]|nr:hypothetical protein [Gemmatimonadota bacterium]
MPIDITAIVGIVMGSMMILIPVAGLTLRFAIKPIVEAVARGREIQGGKQTVELLERRMALMEQQLQQLEGTVERVAEVTEFQHKLASPVA